MPSQWQRVCLSTLVSISWSRSAHVSEQAHCQDHATCTWPDAASLVQLPAHRFKSHGTGNSTSDFLPDLDGLKHCSIGKYLCGGECPSASKQMPDGSELDCVAAETLQFGKALADDVEDSDKFREFDAKKAFFAFLFYQLRYNSGPNKRGGLRNPTAWSQVAHMSSFCLCKEEAPDGTCAETYAHNDKAMPKNQLVGGEMKQVCWPNPAKNIMNVVIQYPSSEYWSFTLLPHEAAIFKVSFANWSSFTSIQACGTDGLVLQAVSAMQVHNLDKCMATGQPNEFVINLLQGIDYNFPLNIVFRQYRGSSGYQISEPAILPKILIIPKSEKDTYDLQEAITSSDYLDNCPLGQVIESSIDSTFQKVLTNHGTKLFPNLTNLTSTSMQMFSPMDLTGLFANKNSKYVMNLLPPNHTGMIYEGQVPPEQPWRTHYGFNAIDYATTATYSGNMQDQLGKHCEPIVPVPYQYPEQTKGNGTNCGWGNKYRVCLFFTLEQATAAGCSEANGDQILLFNQPGAPNMEEGFKNGTAIPATILVYVHFFQQSEITMKNGTCQDGVPRCVDADGIMAAQKEREEMNNTHGLKPACPFSSPYVPNVIYSKAGLK